MNLVKKKTLKDGITYMSPLLWYQAPNKQCYLEYSFLIKHYVQVI